MVIKTVDLNPLSVFDYFLIEFYIPIALIILICKNNTNERFRIYFSCSRFCFRGISKIQGNWITILLNTLPVNVLIVNVIVAFILGAFVILSEQWHLDGRYSLFAAVGFCGSLTTMSLFALDSSDLFENNHYRTLVNIIANIGLLIIRLIGGKSLMSVIISN